MEIFTEYNLILMPAFLALHFSKVFTFCQTPFFSHPCLTTLSAKDFVVKPFDNVSITLNHHYSWLMRKQDVTN